MRSKIRDRDGHRCVICLATCPHPRHHLVDHIVEIVDGGTMDPGNLRTLCKAHHAAKTAAMAEVRRG